MPEGEPHDTALSVDPTALIQPPEPSTLREESRKRHDTAYLLG